MTWDQNLTRTQHGTCRATLRNLIAILTNAREWQGVLAFDEANDRIVTLKIPPWYEDTMPMETQPGPRTPADTLRARVWFEREWGMMTGRASSDLNDALELVARQHPLSEETRKAAKPDRHCAQARTQPPSRSTTRTSRSRSTAKPNSRPHTSSFSARSLEGRDQRASSDKLRPPNGLFCVVCRMPQFSSDGSPTCINGHGDADGIVGDATTGWRCQFCGKTSTIRKWHLAGSKCPKCKKPYEWGLVVN